MAHMCIRHVTMDVSCHIRISHVTYWWAMSDLHESCQIWMSHVTYRLVMSYMDESCHVWVSHGTYGWVMSHIDWSCHIFMSHVSYGLVMSHMNESCHVWRRHVTYEEVIPFANWGDIKTFELCMVQVTHLNESRNMSKWVMSHICSDEHEMNIDWMGHVTHVQISHGSCHTRPNESCPTCAGEQQCV